MSRTVEQSTELDVNWCNREGVLEPGAGTLTWTRERDGEEAASMGYRYVPGDDHGGEGLSLHYTITSRLREPRDVSYTVPIERTECNFGGTRPWFCCPECGDRAAKIYSVPGRDKYICRDCGGLLYKSQTYRSSLVQAFDRLDEASEQAREWPSRENLHELYEAKYGTLDAHEDHLETLDNKYGRGRAERFNPPDPPPFEIWLARMFSGIHNYGYYGQCQATAKTTGERCEQSATGEHGKCYYHGGAPGTGIGDDQRDREAERVEALFDDLEARREREAEATQGLIESVAGDE